MATGREIDDYWLVIQEIRIGAPTADITIKSVKIGVKTLN